MPPRSTASSAVLAGHINTRLVAALGAAGVRAVGLTGADARLGAASIGAGAADGRRPEQVDLGLVGVPAPDADPRLLRDLLSLGYVPVVATLGRWPPTDRCSTSMPTSWPRTWPAPSAPVDRLIAGATPGVLDAAGSSCAALEEQDAAG